MQRLHKLVKVHLKFAPKGITGVALALDANLLDFLRVCPHEELEANGEL